MVKFRWEKEFKETPIGKMPKDWKVKELGKVVQIYKNRIEPSKTPNEIFELYSIPAYLERGKPEIVFGKTIKSSKYLIGPQTILYGRLNPQDPKIWLIGTESEYRQITSTEFFPLKLKGKDSLLFIYYLLKTEFVRGMAEAFSTGTTPSRTRLAERDFLKFEIPYPTPEEQQRIATVLSWFDDLIENKRRQNEVLEKVAMAIFKSWFIDFEPFQDEEFVYREELDMEIPKGWEIKPIGEVAEFTNGLSYKGSEKFSEYVDGAYVFITLNNVQRNGGFKTEYAWIKSGRLKKRHFLVEGDLIIANTDMTQDAKVIGAPALVVFPPNYNKSEGAYSHHITLIRPKEEILKLFMYLYLKYTQEDNVTYSTGTNVLGLDIANFKQNKFILVPPKPILEKFHSLVEPLFRKIIINEKEIMVLKKARDTLLSQLVFGRLRVEEV